MSAGLLVVERVVLESLSKKGKKFDELQADTNLKTPILLNILQNFLMRNFVSYKKGTYSLNLLTKSSWLPLVNARENIKEEVKELFVSLVNSYFKTEKKNNIDLKMKKVWLTDNEEKIYKTLLSNLENFIKNLEGNRGGVKESISSKKVLIWGHSDYSTLVNGVLEAV